MPKVLFGLIKGSLNCARVANGARKYSSKPWIGKHFESLEEVDAFIGKETWSVNNLLNAAAQEGVVEEKVSNSEIEKLLKSSGLPSATADIQQIKKTLSSQIQIIDVLKAVDIDESSLDEKHSRLLPRRVSPLTYSRLMKKIEISQESKDLGEVTGSWNPTEQAQMSANGFFVVREGLLKNRN